MNNTYANPENAAKITELKKELARLKEQYKVPAEPPPQNVRKKKAPKKGGKGKKKKGKK